jgi:Ca2+-binding EF-hand superfamily protein
VKHRFFINSFSLMDQNADGSLTEPELLAFMDGVQERQARAVGATPAVLFSEKGTGLFDLLDEDQDGQLSLYEAHAAPGTLVTLGKEREGVLGREDLLPSYQLVLGLGRARFSLADDFLTPREMPTLSLSWGTPELIWFHKMDRNRDGSLSAREFLGTRAIFQRLDRDRNGLIDAREAGRANELGEK